LGCLTPCGIGAILSKIFSCCFCCCSNSGGLLDFLEFVNGDHSLTYMGISGDDFITSSNLGFIVYVKHLIEFEHEKVFQGYI
jgi:hypothetical protein